MLARGGARQSPRPRADSCRVGLIPAGGPWQRVPFLAVPVLAMLLSWLALGEVPSVVMTAGGGSRHTVAPCWCPLLGGRLVELRSSVRPEAEGFGGARSSRTIGRST